MGVEPTRRLITNVGLAIRCLTIRPTLLCCNYIVNCGYSLQEFGGTSRTRTDHLLLAKQALSQMSYGPMAGDDGLEPPNVGIKIRCLTNLANPQQNLAYPQGFEPRPTVLETVMLPLTPGIHCNALLPMRVFKDTIVNLALALVLESRRIMSLNTLPFYISRLLPETYLAMDIKW